MKEVEQLYDMLKKIQESENYNLIVLMVTNIMEGGSKLLVVGEKSYVEGAFNKELEKGVVYLPKVMSRKKEVVAPLERMF